MPLWVQVPKFYCFGAATSEQKVEKAEQKVKDAQQEAEKAEQKAEKAQQEVEKAQQKLNKDVDNEQNKTLLSIAILNLKSASDNYQSTSVLTSARMKLAKLMNGGM